MASYRTGGAAALGTLHPDTDPAAAASSVEVARVAGSAGIAARDGGRCASAASLRHLGYPVILMNVPLSLSTEIVNNAIMAGLDGPARDVDLPRAIRQFVTAYRTLSRHAVIYLLPSRPGLQDQPYVANLAAVLPHLDEETVVVSRFRSQPRVGETAVGLDFFRLFGFAVVAAPAEHGGTPLFFEGEADLKHLGGNCYVGAWGLRTSRSALSWFASRFDMDIIAFRMRDPHLYHLDCCLLPLAGDTVALCTAVADAATVRAIERRCAVIDVPLEGAHAGTTNSLVLDGTLYCDTTIRTISAEDPWYARETLKVAFLEKVCADRGLRLVMLDISEFYKSGAALSCMLMRLNHPHTLTRS